LRLVVNPADELAWFRVAQLLDGVGPATARRVATAGGASAALAIDAVPTVAIDQATELAAALDAAASVGLVGQPAAQIERARLWLDARVRARRRLGHARLADFDRLQESAALHPTLERFLTDITLDPPSFTSDLAGPPLLDDDWLTLSTIHSAKGCEWDAVHLLHLSDGNLPSDMACGDADELEEERRLLYVAMTRARDALHCYAPLRYHRFRHERSDVHGYAQLSRFLSPAVREHLDVDGAQPAGRDTELTRASTIPSTVIGDVDAELRALLG
jgi:DNA helicase-2/ATP-dependent DNA helicase PcrA